MINLTIKSEKMEVLIRYNNKFPLEKQWRIIVDGIEQMVDSVKIETPSFTSTNKMPNGDVKSHICCNASKVTYKIEHTDLVAYINN